MIRLLHLTGKWQRTAPLCGGVSATFVSSRAASSATHGDSSTARTAAHPPTKRTPIPAPRGPPLQGGPTTPPQHPMELLSYVFQHHPSALRLHRELTIALASGDAARAADLAGVLASTVQRVVSAQAAATSSSATAAADDREDGAFTGNGASDVPVPAPADVDAAMEKTQQEVERRLAEQEEEEEGKELQRNTDASSSPPASEEAAEAPPFWRDPQHLCVTVLESAFETDVPDGEAQDALSPAGNRAAAHEAEQVRILDAYLDKEKARWKLQKAAIAKIVLDVARGLRVVPEDLQSAEGMSDGGSTGASHQASNAAAGTRLNVLRHSNVVIRGEVPAATAGVGEVDEELAALEERMSSMGSPLTPAEVQMARYELQMSRSKMRYVVGVHRELQLALDSSEALREAAKRRAGESKDGKEQTGTQLFMDEVLRALNEGAASYGARASSQGLALSLEDVNAREAVENPVLPFTFMLKCCLWFDTAPPAPKQ